jgi:hypothetical protein
MTRNRALVLCHHAVSETWPDDLAIPPDVLVGQIPKLLGRGTCAGDGGRRAGSSANFPCHVR